MITQTENTQLGQFYIAGISTRTTNAGNQAGADIHALWDRFINEDVAKSIPDKVFDDIYSVYTDYESDHTGRYTVVLGCKVRGIEGLPGELSYVLIPAGNYQANKVEGQMPEAVVSAWQEIWETRDDRAYTADFEVYGVNEEGLRIFLAVK